MSIILSNPNFKRQAKALGAECAIATVYTGVSCLFARNNAVRVLLIAKAATMLGVNFACRSLKAWVDHVHEGSSSKSDQIILKISGVILSTTCAIQMAQVDYCTRNVLVHEGGHALVGMAVFTNAYPRVQITGVGTGQTGMVSINTSQPILWFEGGEFLYRAGGPVASLASTVVMIALAHFWGDAYDGFGEYLYEAAALTVSQHIRYANSTSSSNSHDFAFMARAGMPAWIWVGIFAIVPLATWLLLFVYDKTVAGNRAALSDGENTCEEVVVNT